MSPNRVLPPPDGPTDRIGARTLLNTIAAGILVLSAVMGIIYLDVWQGASEDLSKLLPASTRTHATTQNPLAGLERALTLKAWRDPAAMRRAVTGSGLWREDRDEPTDADQGRPCPGCRLTELAGIPIGVARELLRAMDGVEVAVVPSSEGVGLLLFVELRDPSARKRILTRLRPVLETVDREVGFRIDRLRPRPWTSLIGFDLDPPRLADMEPWLVFSWGDPAPLEELLSARVGGRHDALRRRFKRPAPKRTGEAPLSLVVDARSAWQIATGTEPRPGGLVEYLDLMTLSARVEGPFDPLELQVEVSDRDLSQRLASALARGPHPLLEQVPSESLFALSLRGDDLPVLASTTAQLLALLSRDAGLAADPDLPDIPLSPLLARLGLPPALDALLAELPSAPSELVFAFLPGPAPESRAAPVLLLRSSTPYAAEAALAAGIPRWLGDGWAHGEVLHEGRRLYLERPHGGGPGLAWWLRDGIIEIATSFETLGRLESAESRLDLDGLGLDPQSGVAAVFRPELFPTGHPLSAILRDRLRDDTLVLATLDASADRLTLRANTGLWTLLTALASASPDELDALLLDHLTPACRKAYEAFCEVYPRAAPCQPLALGRLPHIEAVCESFAP